MPIGHPAAVATFRTRAQAEKWARDLDVRIDDGRNANSIAQVHARANRCRVSQAREEIATHAKRSRRTRIVTRADRDARLQWWGDRHGDLRLNKIDGALILRALRDLESENIGSADEPRHRAAQTCRHYIIALQSLLTFARKSLRWVDGNAVADLDVPPVSPGRIR